MLLLDIYDVIVCVVAFDQSHNKHFYQACRFTWRSPTWQKHALGNGGAKPKGRERFAGSGTKPEGFLKVAAKFAAWKVEKCQLARLAKRYSVELPVAATLFQIVLKLIQHVLPVCSEHECLQYTRHRVALGMKQEKLSDEVMACDEATAVLENNDAGNESSKKGGHWEQDRSHEFRKEFRQTAAMHHDARTNTQVSANAERRKRQALRSQYQKNIP